MLLQFDSGVVSTVNHSTKASSALSVPSCLSRFSLFSVAGRTETSTVNSGIQNIFNWTSSAQIVSTVSNTSFGTAHSSFSLAPCFPPIPSKTVRKIQALEFVELRELLPDNISLTERLESLPHRPWSLRDPVAREISSLPTWMSAFATYIAIVSEAHPYRVRDMCAYMRLIVQEAQKFGGTGWLTYDTIFRKNNTGPSARWDRLDPSLHIAHIIARADGRVTAACIYCNEVDHRSEDCALSSRPPSSGPSSGPSASRDWLRPQGRPTRSTPYSRAPPPGSSRTAICSSWNRGRCAFPGTCNFRHVCVLCLGNHQARSCSNSGRGPSQETPRPPVVTSSSVHR